MIRRLLISTAIALALAGALGVPSVAEAAGPTGIFCLITEDTDLYNPGDFTMIGIPDPLPGFPWSAPNVRLAVALCRSLGGHPWGIA